MAVFANHFSQAKRLRALELRAGQTAVLDRRALDVEEMPGFHPGFAAFRPGRGLSLSGCSEHSFYGLSADACLGFREGRCRHSWHGSLLLGPR